MVIKLRLPLWRFETNSQILDKRSRKIDSRDLMPFAIIALSEADRLFTNIP
jgi:hypothetical protein